MGSHTTARHWVLLRGLSRDSRHWESFPAQLQRRFPTDRISCLDLPGTGRHCQHQSPVAIAQIVDWIRKENRQILNEPIHLVTISMGGMVAADWMHRYPDEITAAVMINTSSRLNVFFERMKPRALLALTHALCTSAKIREQIIVDWTCNHADKRKGVAARWLQYHQQQPATARTIIRQLLAASRFTPKPVEQPLLMLAAKEDRLVSYLCSSKLAQFWQADLKIHPSAGHDIALDDSDWLLHTISTWLSALESQVMDV